jgi:hypothetical protein
VGARAGLREDKLTGERGHQSDKKRTRLLRCKLFERVLLLDEHLLVGVRGCGVLGRLGRLPLGRRDHFQLPLGEGDESRPCVR